MAARLLARIRSRRRPEGARTGARRHAARHDGVASSEPGALAGAGGRGLRRRDLLGRGARTAVGLFTPDPASGGRSPTSVPCPWRHLELPAGIVALESGVGAQRHFDEAREWMILMASALVGIGTRSIEIGVEYVKERKAFGVPIGSFQAVSHGLADAATAVEAACCWPARRPGRPGRPGGRPSLGAPGLRLHCRVGPRGELPQPALPRRATASCSSTTSSCTSGGPRRGRPSSASRTWPSPTRPAPPGAARQGGVNMDFRLGENSDAFRAEARAFSTRCSPPRCGSRWTTPESITTGTSTGSMVERGWLAPGWPVEYGGQGRDPLEMLAFAEEFQRAGAPTYGVGTTFMIANIIRHLGTEEQKRLDPSRRPSGGDHHRARFHRARVGVRRGRRPDPRRPRRGRVGDQRSEDVHHQCAGGGLRLHAHPDQPRRGQAPRPDHVPGAAESARGGDPDRCTPCRESGPT